MGWQDAHVHMWIYSSNLFRSGLLHFFSLRSKQVLKLGHWDDSLCFTPSNSFSFATSDDKHDRILEAVQTPTSPPRPSPDFFTGTVPRGESVFPASLPRLGLSHTEKMSPAHTFSTAPNGKPGYLTEEMPGIFPEQEKGASETRGAWGEGNIWS